MSWGKENPFTGPVVSPAWLRFLPRLLGVLDLLLTVYLPSGIGVFQPESSIIAA